MCWLIKAASDPKIRIPTVLVPKKDLVSNSESIKKITELDLAKFVSSSFVPSFKLEELDSKDKDLVSSSNALLSSAATNDSDYLVIPTKN